MNRRNFLRNLGISLGTLTIPKGANTQEIKKLTYSFDEIFYRPYEGNQNLIYVKDNSILADKIYEIISDDDLYKKLSINAREMMETRMNREVYIRAILKSYDVEE